MSGLNGDWYEALKGEFSKPYYRKLFETVRREYSTHLIFPPADDILTQTAYFNNDGQDQSMMSYDEIWNYLSQDTEDEEQLELIQTIASQMEEGSYDKPHYSASITTVQDETKIIADLVWPASKVLLFLRENVESFEAAQSTNWTSFCLDDDFNIPAFIQKIKR